LDIVIGFSFFSKALSLTSVNWLCQNFSTWHGFSVAPAEALLCQFHLNVPNINEGQEPQIQTLSVTNLFAILHATNWQQEATCIGWRWHNFFIPIYHAHCDSVIVCSSYKANFNLAAVETELALKSMLIQLQ